MRPYFTYRDRRHWTFDVWRFGVYRWCPGAPCSLPGVRRERHMIRFAWQS